MKNLSTLRRKNRYRETKNIYFKKTKREARFISQQNCRLLGKKKPHASHAKSLSLSLFLSQNILTMKKRKKKLWSTISNWVIQYDWWQPYIFLCRLLKSKNCFQSTKGCCCIAFDFPKWAKLFFEKEMRETRGHRSRIPTY